MTDIIPSRRTVLAGIGATALMSGVPQMSAASTPVTHQMTVGDILVTAVSDGHFDLPAAAFANTGGHKLADTVKAGATLWAISSGERTILVDSGSGVFLKGNYPATGQMSDHLAAAGIDPARITDIVITHMHADHIGGLLLDGKSLFPNAAMHFQEAEWTYWMAPERPTLVPEAQRPLAGLIQSIAGELAYSRVLHQGETDLGSGIRLVPAPGHTPGHQIVRVSSGPDQLLLLGDALISGALQFAHPDATYILDSDPELAARTRRTLFDMVASDGIPFCATHLVGLEKTRLAAQGDSFQVIKQG